MKFFAKICITGLCGVLGTTAGGNAWSQANPGQAPPAQGANPIKPPAGNAPGVRVQVPGVNVQTPGANPQRPPVNVQAPGVNVQVPGPNGQVDNRNGNARLRNNNGYYTQTPWFSNPVVREQLQLNEQQLSRLNQGYQQSWTRYNRERNLLGDNLTPEQRLRREGELRSEFQRGFSPAVDASFTDTTARQRYNQMYWQYQGYDAFNDPTLQQQLELTPEQRQQLNEHGTAWNQQFDTWRSDYPRNRDRVGKELRDARREARQRINSTLTPEQRTKWNTVIGQPFEFEPDVYFHTEPTPNTTLKPAID